MFYVINWQVLNAVGTGKTNGIEVFTTKKARDAYMKKTSLVNDVHSYKLSELSPEQINEMIWYPRNQEKSINNDYDLPLQFH